MKTHAALLFAGATAWSVASHADELRCADRIAQGSVAIVRVVPTETVRIDMPPGVNVGTDAHTDARATIFYKGGVTDHPLSFATDQGRYEVCAVLAKSGEKPDQHVVLARRNLQE